MPTSMLTTTLTRLRRLILMDLDVLDEVRADTAALIPAIATAVVSMLLLAMGGWLWWVISGLGDRGSVFLKSVVFGSLFALFAWLIWLLVAYTVLQRVGRITLPVDQVIRVAGFATFPLGIGILMAIPSISFGVGLVALAGWVAMTQVALERVAGHSSGALVLANVAGFGAWAIVMSLLATGSNQVAPGPFLAESIWDAITGANVIFR
jgi:hypothetical protein